MGRVFKRKYRDKKTGELRECATYTLELSINGRKVREPTDTTRKEQANALLRERESAIWEGRYLPRAKKRVDLTVGGLRDLWLKDRASKKSLRHDKGRFAAIVKALGEHRVVATLRADDVRDLKKGLAADKAKPATVNRHLALLRSALNLAADSGHTHRDPMRGISFEAENNERDRICTAAEYERLKEGAEGDLRVLVVVAYWTGMRLGEIAGLTRDRLDLRAGTIRLRARDTKEGAAKALPLPAEAIEELHAVPARVDGRVFRCRVESYSRQFSALVGELGIKDLRFHDLRHTAATRMHEAGVDILTIQAFTGHKTLAMLKRYTRVTEARMRRALEQQGAHAAGSEASKR